MVVQHNLKAMNSNRMLGITQGTLSKSTEKLSSGYKINRAADNAAGLSISEKMRKQIRGLTQASTNAEDGISSVQTAEGALQEVTDMLQRMNELVVQAANGTNSTTDRQYIQDEIDQLVTEVDRVAETTKFNETYLLKGDSSAKATKTYTQNYTVTYTDYRGSNENVKIQVKYVGSDAYIFTSASINSAANGGTALAHSITTGSNITEYATSVTKQTTQQSVAINTTSFAAFKMGAVKDDLTLTSSTIDGLTATTDTYILDKTNNQVIKINSGEDLSKYLKNVTTDAAGTSVTFKEMADGFALLEKQSSASLNSKAIMSEKILYDSLGNEVSGVKLRDYFDTSGTYKGGLYTSKEANSGNVLNTKAEVAKYVNKTVNEVAADLSFNLHVGADSDKTNKITARIQSMSSAALGVNALKSTQAGIVDTTGQKATDAIDVIADALQKVSTQRSSLGAIQNRLEHTIKNLDNVVENTTSAESTIRDTDMATEMVKYSNANILSQAGQSMLAQSNQSNQGVLSLLG